LTPSPTADKAVGAAGLALLLIGFLVAPFWGADFHRQETTVLFADRWIAVATLVLLNLAALGVLLMLRETDSGGLPAAGAVLLALAAALLLRLDTFYEAFERDLMIYSTIAGDLLRGKLLYVDAWDIKPPAVFWTYAAAARLYGTSPAAIWVLGLITTVGTAIACYFAGRELGGVRGGAFAALVWCLLSGDLVLQANQPNVESFLNLLVATGFYVCLKRRRNPGDVSGSLLIGALFAAATLYKQIALLVFLALGVVMFASRMPEQPRRWRQELHRIGIAAAVIACGWLLTAAYFGSLGTLEPFLHFVFALGADYAGNPGQNLVEGLDPARYRLVMAYLPLAAVSAAVLYFARSRLDPLGPSLLAAYAVGAWLAVVLPGKFHPHYFQLLLPPLAILCGWGAGRIGIRRHLWIALFGVALVPALAQRMVQTWVPVDSIPIYKYGPHGIESLESRRIGQWLGKHAPGSATLFHWGAEPGVHFWSGRPPAVRFIAHFPLFMDPRGERAARIERELVAELAAARPDLIALNTGWVGASRSPVGNWIAQHYREATDRPQGLTRYTLLVPK